MNSLRKRTSTLGGGLALMLAFAVQAPAESRADAALLKDACGTCHTGDAPNLSRIEGQRKSPEGWLMTVVRMRQQHGLEFSATDQAKLISYLSDTRGLAPSETEGYRYIMEREPNVVEGFTDGGFVEMCARCHSGARVALQRRTEEEWKLLTHFHLGQYPTTEFQALGRDRDWFEIALNDMPPQLTKMWPLNTDAWTKWRAADKPQAAGSWRIAADLPGQGQVEGRMTAIADGSGYKLSGQIDTAGGKLNIAGRVNVYTGFEWRGSLTIGGTDYRQVLALNEDGSGLAGRMFRADADELGGSFRAVRIGGDAAVLAVMPGHIRAGESKQLTIIGSGLSGKVALGDGVTVSKVISSAGDRIVVEAKASSDAGAADVAVSVGDTSGSGVLTVYSGIDQIRVEPSYGVARVGGNGGLVAPVKTQFQAIGYANGPDGKQGTDDDIRIGRFEADWNVAPFDEVAEELEDVKHAGRMDRKTGLFSPAGAGLNPERPFSTNNAGKLTVVATVKDGGTATQGKGELLVTVQRWNTPPLR